MTTDLKRFDSLSETNLQIIQQILVSQSAPVPENVEGYGAIYCLKSRSGNVVYVGKSSTHFGALARVVDHIRNAKRFHSWSRVLVKSDQLDRVEQSLIAMLKPQYNCQFKKEYPSLSERIAGIFPMLKKQFTIHDVIAELKKTTQSDYKRESVLSAMSKIKKEMFFTKQCLHGPGRCAIYEKIL